MRAVLLRCPYCMEGFDFKDPITRCSRCGATHHQICWEENHHCSVYACEGLPCLTRLSFSGWIEYVPAILLVLLALHPALLIPFGFLWFPSAVCAANAAVRLFLRTLHATTESKVVPVFGVAMNVAGIVGILLRLTQ